MGCLSEADALISVQEAGRGASTAPSADCILSAGPRQQVLSHRRLTRESLVAGNRGVGAGGRRGRL